ncbi:MAG: DUF499 domain-containing protein [Albidovulum sp.]|nr:DUF499 domain-containing protein [Albidovulum sp.]
MAKSTRQYVFEGMEILPEALIPFVEMRLKNSLTGYWEVQVTERVKGLNADSSGGVDWDQATLLNAMDRFWPEAFRMVLGRAERSIVNELADVRNKLAHNQSFTYDDAERALDSMRRLLEAIGAGAQAQRLSRMRDTILRTKFTELQRNEERRKARRKADISVDTTGGLLPWRKVVEPHPDVATGEFLHAEFAADLGKVHAGTAPSEYSDPKEFFGRTYLTDGLSTLLVGAAKRLSATGGDPVVELQTSFGGGKTHSMLALYHMAGQTPAGDLPGLDRLLSNHDVTVPRDISRAVLVGTWRGPLDVISVRGGREIRTTWGEMAWQLGGADTYDMIAENDLKGIAPGSHILEEMFRKASPCLILIDEWVAYLRQVYKVDGLPSGSFDANLSFVQALTEAVKTSPGTVLVAALPASQIEVGGEGGQEALTRLKQTFARVESPWRSASQEESYEIVRSRLFKEIPGDKFHHRDNALKQFAKLYRENADEFPRSSADEDYRRKLERAYPIHPELFDQLYTSWGTLEQFQRTRGVLRLMAQAIHELWMNNDSSVMIMPGCMAVGSSGVESELLRYLDTSWQSIIAGDIDGPESIPYEIDRSAPNLNRCSATRRVARTIFMGTAPIYQQENSGLDDKRINLAVVQPGEKPAVFGDALRRLGDRARFMHVDRGRYWYSMSAGLNRVAADRAEQIEEELVMTEIDKRLANYVNGLADRGDFEAVQVAPSSSADIPDEAGGVRAVVLGVLHSHNGRDGSEAMATVKDFLAQRGSTPRVYRNVLVFLAAESRQVDHLKEAMRSALAWEGIVRDTERLNLTQRDSALAREKSTEASGTVRTRLMEAWNYLLYPRQESAEAEISWISGKVPAQDGLLKRASKRLVDEEGLLPELGPTRLNRELDRYLWKQNHHLSLKDLREYLDRYTYLPRLKDRSVLVRTVSSAIGNLLPGPFAYAERWDDTANTYQGLAISEAETVSVVIDKESLIVRPEIAEAHRPQPSTATGPQDDTPTSIDGDQSEVREAATSDDKQPANRKPTRFTGTVKISSERPAREIQKVVEGIVEQLTTLPNSEVDITLEIVADVPSGLDRVKVRSLTENANTLGFIEKSVR